VKFRKLAFGIATHIPGVLSLPRRWKGTGGTDSARYCYSVWLRHLVLAHQNGLCSGVPAAIGELGPGDSIGIGLAALLSGAKTYWGLDVAKYANLERNLGIFDELVELLRSRADIPDATEFPAVKPRLQSYEFPHAILRPEVLAAALDPARISRLREAIRSPSSAESVITYFAPWADRANVRPGTLDMIFSQAVLEHVDDLDEAYSAMRLWLSPDGFVSHQIDFKCHGLADEWNGHWACSDFKWNLLRGKRPYLLNREPLSTHVRLMREHGFDAVFEQLVTTPSQVTRAHLAERFRSMSEQDFTTSAAFIQARLQRSAAASRR
jgi:hypothetical protein